MSESTFLKFGAETATKYQWLREEVFAGASNPQVFFLAMAFGIKHKFKAPADFAKANTGPRTDISAEDFALMKIMQVSTSGDPTALSEDSERYDLAMRYAEAGVTKLLETLEGLSTREARIEVLSIMQGLLDDGARPEA